MAKAITTIKQVLNYPTNHAVWFAVNQALFNQIAVFYLEVISNPGKVSGFLNKEALRAREMLTHTRKRTQHQSYLSPRLEKIFRPYFAMPRSPNIPRQLRLSI